MVKIDSFYIKLFFIISLFLNIACLPVLAEEETAELSIESNFNVSKSTVRNCVKHDITCIDTVTKLNFKNTKRKSVDFKIDTNTQLLSVLENGKKANIKFKDYRKDIISVPVTTPNSLISISTSTRERPSKILRVGNNFSNLTITSPYPNIILNNIKWKVYSDYSTYFTYDKFSHGDFSEVDKNSSVLNTKNPHFNSDTQTTSDYFFKINKVFYIFAILSIITFTFLGGIDYIKNILYFPFYGFSENSTNDKKHAFTLIELIIVIAIIGVLASMVTPHFSHKCYRLYGESEYEDCIKNQKKYTPKDLINLAKDADEGILTANLPHDSKWNTYSGIDRDCPNLGLYYFDDKNEICCTLHGKESTGAKKAYYNYNQYYYEVDYDFFKYFNYELPIYKYSYKGQLPYCSFVANKINPVDSHLSLEIKYVGREGWQTTMCIQIAVYIFVFVLPFIFGKKIKKWRNS